MESSLRRIRSIADYQYGAGMGEKLFPYNVEIQYSPATGRIRYINLNGERIATLRPTDGMLSLSVNSARFVRENVPSARCFVTVKSEIAKFVADGGDVFAAHVVKVDDDICAKDEVIILDEEGQVLGVGRTLLSSVEIKAFKTGVAVKVRHGRGHES